MYIMRYSKTANINVKKLTSLKLIVRKDDAMISLH